MSVTLICVIMMLYMLVIMGTVYLFVGKCVAIGQLFVKAGDKAWKAVIPVYSTYTMFKLTWSKMWFWVYMIPLAVFTVSFSAIYITALTVSNAVSNVLWILVFVSIIIYIPVYIAFLWHVAKAFSREAAVGFTFGLVFLESIFYMILGFGKSEYLLGKNDE